MPAGVYPEWKNKAQTVKHPAAGLSKNKYDAKGQLRPPRKSRSKLTKKKEKYGIKAEEDISDVLKKRMGLFNFLVNYNEDLQDEEYEDIATDIDDTENFVDIFKNYVKDPTLLASKEAGELYKQFLPIYNERHAQYKDFTDDEFVGPNEDWENARQDLNWWADNAKLDTYLKKKMVGKASDKYQMKVLMGHIDAPEYKKKSEVYYDPSGSEGASHPTFLKKMVRKEQHLAEQDKDHPLDIFVGGEDDGDDYDALTFMRESMGVKGIDKKATFADRQSYEDIALDLMTSRGLVRQRAKRWDAGLTKAEKIKEKARREALKADKSGIPTEVSGTFKEQEGEDIRLHGKQQDPIVNDPDETFKQYDYKTIEPDRPIGAHAQDLMNQFFGEIAGSDISSKENIFHTIVSKKTNIMVEPQDEEDLNPSREGNVADFFDKISKDSRRIGQKVLDTQDIPPPRAPSPIDLDFDEPEPYEEERSSTPTLPSVASLGLDFLKPKKTKREATDEEMEQHWKYEKEQAEKDFVEKKVIKIKKKKKKLVIKGRKETDHIWKENTYLMGYPFGAKGSQFDTFEEAYDMAKKHPNKVAGITKMKKYGKTKYSVRSGAMGNYRKSPSGEKSIFTNPSKHWGTDERQ